VSNGSMSVIEFSEHFPLVYILLHTF